MTVHDVSVRGTTLARACVYIILPIAAGLLNKYKPGNRRMDGQGSSGKEWKLR